MFRFIGCLSKKKDHNNEYYKHILNDDL